MNCLIENNNIFKLEYGQKECIGVTAAAYKELENDLITALEKAENYKQLSEEYKQKLIDNGLMTVPKTAEEIQMEILQGLNNLTGVVNNLGKRLEVLENESSSNIENSETTQCRTDENNGSIRKGKAVSK
ncbi:MAG: hypothetical protein RSD79_05870 [Cetobacterium sp.]